MKEINPNSVPYPVYEAPEGKKRFDTDLPSVRERLVRSARAAIEAGIPILPEARDALVITDPDLAAELGVTSPDTAKKVPIREITKEEEAALALKAQRGYAGRQRHSSGAAGVAIAHSDYQGNLGGGTPRNPLRVPGIIHR